MNNNKNAIFVLDDFFGDDEFTHDMSPREAWDCIKRLLNEQEQIVRCKDCKHGYRCEFGIRCENKNMPPVFGQHFSENWFCADGERRGLNELQKHD